MTREDMLRELELMPLWTLRNPLSVLLAPIVVDELASTLQTEPDSVPSNAAIELPATEVSGLQYLRSEDGNYLFALAHDTQPQESMLLSAMLMAMAVKAKKVSIKSIAEAKALEPKLVLALGESSAQYLLQSTQTLSELRGIINDFSGIALVATYDLGHLLLNWKDKAHAWEDLCLAMMTLEDLTA